MHTTRRSPPGARLTALADRLLRAGGESAPGLGALPPPADIGALVEEFMAVFFPESGRSRELTGNGRAHARQHLAGVLADMEHRLEDAVFLGLHRRCPQSGTDQCRGKARAIARRLVNALPDIRGMLAKDVQAAFDADPAASGTDEIVACYPGLYAIAVYRAANRLFREGAEIVPRMMTEHAHSRTGIDIHPGATIGASFFIDHGTGIVVGETTVIGASVRIYQGVTLGAMSVKRPHRDGTRRGPVRRHPTIEDDVVIYANATILGGDTVIGRGAVVGGNAFITYSVPPGVRVA